MSEPDYYHHVPYFDPLEAMQPAKAMIRECSKQLKQQCYEINKKKIEIKNNPEIPEWLKGVAIDELEHQLKPLVSRIKLYARYIKFGGKPAGENSRRITESDKDRARQYPIADLYPGKLKKAGVRLLGTCPFHNEKTASFVVYPNNTYHCFGCQENGDSIKFVMKINNIGFIETVKKLI